MRQTEARLANNNNVLLLLPGATLDDLALKEGESFWGRIWQSDAHISMELVTDMTIYILGDVDQAPQELVKLLSNTDSQVLVVAHLCTNYETKLPNANVITLGRIPILMHGTGVLYRNFFQPGYFQKIQSEHAFQALAFSNKPGVALRTGIYLTPVQHDPNTNEKHFRLLRCSTNLAGPTADFQTSDHEIVNALNQQAASIFDNAAPVNHVLAQIYHNRSSNTQKQRKASIKAHSDKTKDMPSNGIMAFCTFYDDIDQKKLKPIGPFDYGHKGISALTTLHFSLKSCVRANPENAGLANQLATQFRVTLYPDSVFFMPLSTNRLYTHEIRPGMLDARMLPTRMGYVVRCSNMEAVHKSVPNTEGNGPNTATFLKMNNGDLVPLESPTPEGMRDLHKLYKEENISDGLIDYGQRRFLFSMNAGDYALPMTYNVQGGRNEFRKLQLDTPRNPFTDLQAATRFEAVGKGRQGTVLVLPDKDNIPIVRTTTKYQSPAQTFQPVHQDLAEQIQRQAALPVPFNNALAEVYDHQYAKMGFHSDQNQDLLDGSTIALYSCYEDPSQPPNRKLVVEPKDGNPDGKGFELELTHNSVVLFSLDTNRRFRHKIVLDHNNTKKSNIENRWMGLTFRTSKTFVHFEGEKALLADGTALRLSTGDSDRSFYNMRGCENREIDFRYPALDYTISESDLMPPVQQDIGHIIS